MTLRSCALLVCLVSACGGDSGVDAVDAGPQPDATPALDGAVSDASIPAQCELNGTGESHYFVVDTLDVAAPVASPTVVPGFDLDGIVSDGFDSEGCFHPDFMSGPPDNVEGVDSQVGAALLTLGFIDDITNDFRSTLQAGELVILVGIHGVDDLTNDDCVHVELSVGDLVSMDAPPTLDSDGRFVAGQSFRQSPPARLANAETQVRFERGAIRSGRLLAEGGAVFDVGLPLSGSTSFFIRERDMRIAFDVTETELATGVIGGRSRVEETIEINTEAFDDLIFTPSQMRLLLLASADLDRTSEGCQSISISHSFQAVAAQLVP